MTTKQDNISREQWPRRRKTWDFEQQRDAEAIYRARLMLAVAKVLEVARLDDTTINEWPELRYAVQKLRDAYLAVPTSKCEDHA